MAIYNEICMIYVYIKKRKEFSINTNGKFKLLLYLINDFLIDSVNEFLFYFFFFC